MNNRIWGLLILWIVFWLWYLFYWYYFVYSLVNITFTTNVDTFSVSMESQHKNYNFECNSNSCEYPQVSPFTYNVTLQSPEHKEVNYTWTPSKQSAIQSIEFQKDYKLVADTLLSQEDATQLLNNTIDADKQETIQEKIQKLKDKQQTHLIFELNKNIYKFKKDNNWLVLYQNNEVLGYFDYAEKSKISLQEIVSNENYLAISIGHTQYIFSKLTGKTHEYTLAIPVKYIKSTDKNGEFIFVTEKWSFIYDIYKNKFEYNSYFSDFVFLNKNTYIWVIYKDDIEKNKRLKNKANNNLVILLEPASKKEEILLETEKDIEKIFKKDGKIYFEDKNTQTFFLSHLKE